jgi:methyl-accepting chemotaxis protein
MAVTTVNHANPRRDDGAAGDGIAEEPPNLIQIRTTASKWFVALIWAFVPALALIAWAAGNSVLFSASGAVLVALAAMVAWYRDAAGPVTRYTIAAAMACQWMLLIYATVGAPDGLVLDAHMMYFVMNAFVAIYFCWRSIIVVTVIPAIHHTILSFLFPTLIWPSDNYALLHYGNHVLFVVMLSGVMLWFTWRLHGVFVESHSALQRAERERERAELMAEGRRDGETRAAAERQQMLSGLAANFERSVSGVVGDVTKAAARMREDAGRLTGAAEQTNARSAAVLTAAAQTASNVAIVAAATEQLTSSVGEIGRQVGDSTKIADAAVREADRTNDAVSQLSEAAAKIGNVVELINGIASQTNLLALNATIEAARAGEAGKGFAVVASEVKNLANQTARATEDIQAEVSQMQAVTATAVAAIRSIGGTIGSINSITGSIAAAVEEQGAATGEIARSIQEAVRVTEEMKRDIESVSDIADQTGTMAKDALATADDLSRQTEGLRNEIDSFIRQVRSA